MALAAEFRHQLSLQFLNISKFAIADRTSQNVQNWHLKSGSILSSIFDVTAARFLVLFFYPLFSITNHNKVYPH